MKRRIAFIILTAAAFLALNVTPALADYWMGH